MKLQRAIDLAHDLTSRLHEALEHPDLKVCQDLLEQRRHAMVEFERTHRTASAHQRTACHSALLSLNRADVLLQERTKAMLGMVTGEFREQLGLSNSGKHPTAGEPMPACLDRKV